MQRRRAIRSAGQFLARDDRLGAAGLRRAETGLDLRERRGVDERSREHAGILGRAELQFAHATRERIDEAVGDLAMHEHALGAGAALPGAEVAADGHFMNCLAKGAVVEHDAHVLAAHLERDQQLRAIGRRFENALADGPAAGEA